MLRKTHSSPATTSIELFFLSLVCFFFYESSSCVFFPQNYSIKPQTPWCHRLCCVWQSLRAPSPPPHFVSVLSSHPVVHHQVPKNTKVEVSLEYTLRDPQIRGATKSPPRLPKGDTPHSICAVVQNLEHLTVKSQIQCRCYWLNR